MTKIVSSLLIAIGLGFGVGYWQGTSSERIGSGLVVEDRAPLERRLSDLETSLALERYERQALADEFEDFRDSRAAQPAPGFGGDDGSEPLAEQIPARVPDRMPQSPEELDQLLRQQQVDRFVAAGIASGRAQAILQREEEIEMEVLRARYAATQSGASTQEVAGITPLALLRGELGDTEYAQYLDARGRATSVRVREVLKSSPAEVAGLKPGDEIVAYNGQRVFDMNELTALTFQTRTGTTVPLELIRDGQSIQIYVEAGPVGIGGGGRP